MECFGGLRKPSCIQKHLLGNELTFITETFPFTPADPFNWKIPVENLTEICNDTTNNPDPNQDWGTGGFAPFGFEGIMEGAATCFFGFVGFDVIATTGKS